MGERDYVEDDADNVIELELAAPLPDARRAGSTCRRARSPPEDWERYRALRWPRSSSAFGMELDTPARATRRSGTCGRSSTRPPGYEGEPKLLTAFPAEGNGRRVGDEPDHRGPDRVPEPVRAPRAAVPRLRAHRLHRRRADHRHLEADAARAAVRAAVHGAGAPRRADRRRARRADRAAGRRRAPRGVAPLHADARRRGALAHDHDLLARRLRRSRAAARVPARSAQHTVALAGGRRRARLRRRRGARRRARRGVPRARRPGRRRRPARPRSRDDGRPPRGGRPDLGRRGRGAVGAAGGDGEPRWVVNAVGGFRAGTRRRLGAGRRPLPARPEPRHRLVVVPRGRAAGSPRGRRDRQRRGAQRPSAAARARPPTRVAKAGRRPPDRGARGRAAERRVRVNAVLPSVIDTPANRASRPADADRARRSQPAELAVGRRVPLQRRGRGGDRRDRARLRLGMSRARPSSRASPTLRPCLAPDVPKPSQRLSACTSATFVPRTVPGTGRARSDMAALTWRWHDWKGPGSAHGFAGVSTLWPTFVPLL